MVDNAGHHKVLMAKKNSNIAHSKSRVNLEQVIGCEWGTVFAVKDRNTGDIEEVTDPQTTLTTDFFLDDEVDDVDMEAGEGKEESKDNRNIVDNNTSQSMTAEEITKLKESADGKEIIDQLIQGSATWD